MAKLALVCDTTVLLYLNRIGLTHLLPALFEPVYIPQTVLLELDMGRLTRSDTIDPRSLRWPHIVHVPDNSIDSLPPNHLGRDERAVIACAHTCGIDIAGLDELKARQLAKEMNLTVIGTLGVLLRAKRSALISEIPSLGGCRRGRGLPSEPKPVSGRPRDCPGRRLSVRT